MASNNFLPVQISVKTLATALKRGGLLSDNYSVDRQQANQFIKAATNMGFHYDEAKTQVISDQHNFDKKKEKNGK